jgi:hypothetical protein
VNAWTDNELTRIGQADELRLASFRQDGTLRNPVTIWVVRIGDDLYVRAVKGPTGLWFRHAQERHQGRITAGGISKDVTFEAADDSVKDEIDAAYKSKYDRYGASIVGSTLTPQAQAATLRLAPLSL